MEKFPLCNLRLEQAFVVMALHIVQHGVLRLESLDKHLPLLPFPTCPACHLLQHLIGSFVTAEIGLIKHGVSAEHCHQRHIVEMQPFGNHLRTDKDIHLVVRHGVDNLLISILNARGIEVHAHDASLGEEFLHFLLQPFGAEALHTHLPSACGALLRDRGMVTAVVAGHFLQAHVERERHIAVDAAWRLPASGTLQQGRIAAAVLEEYHLLAACQHLLHTRHQRVAEMVVHLLAVVLPFEVDDTDSGQLQPCIALREAHQPVLA